MTIYFSSFGGDYSKNIISYNRKGGGGAGRRRFSSLAFNLLHVTQLLAAGICAVFTFIRFYCFSIPPPLILS